MAVVNCGDLDAYVGDGMSDRRKAYYMKIQDDGPLRWYEAIGLVVVVLASGALGMWLFKVAVQYFAGCDC